MSAILDRNSKRETFGQNENFKLLRAVLNCTHIQRVPLSIVFMAVSNIVQNGFCNSMLLLRETIDCECSLISIYFFRRIQ